MAPVANVSVSLQSNVSRGDFAFSTAELREQWLHPTDVMSILLLLGGEIVNRALAQLAGGLITPVAFSFGMDSQRLVLSDSWKLI